MKKLFALILTVAMLATMSVTAFAANTTGGSTEVSFNVDPTYTITIPATVELAKETAQDGTVTYENDYTIEAVAGVRLKKNEYIEVTVTSDFEMITAEGATLAYNIAAGGSNVASEIDDTYWVETDYEQLLTWNPEYIILASDANYTVDDVLADPNLTECSAVKNSHVYQMPSTAESWDSPVPSGILGSVWLATILHEDLFSADDASAIIDEYYETFYNFTYSEK